VSTAKSRDFRKNTLYHTANFFLAQIEEISFGSMMVAFYNFQAVGYTDHEISNIVVCEIIDREMFKAQLSYCVSISNLGFWKAFQMGQQY
jgi:hypothetical protein